MVVGDLDGKSGGPLVTRVRVLAPKEVRESLRCLSGAQWRGRICMGAPSTFLAHHFLPRLALVALVPPRATFSILPAQRIQFDFN